MYQQMVIQTFETVLQAYPMAEETDMSFISKINSTLSKMDKGAHIGRWGQLQEWKIDADNQTDTHRHISHLWGMYPGSTLASWNEESPSREEINQAVTNSLEARGNATHYSWAKMHRAAVYSSLGNASYAYHLYKVSHHGLCHH
jgi:alpha-L-fucosidase 2